MMVTDETLYKFLVAIGPVGQKALLIAIQERDEARAEAARLRRQRDALVKFIMNLDPHTTRATNKGVPLLMHIGGTLLPDEWQPVQAILAAIAAESEADHE